MSEIKCAYCNNDTNENTKFKIYTMPEDGKILHCHEILYYCSEEHLLLSTKEIKRLKEQAMTTEIQTQSPIMNDEDRKDLMISIGGKFLDNTEEIMNSLNFTPEEKGDFMMNLISFSRCLFIHASHEQMQLKNDIKWDTLKKSHDMDRNKLRDMMRIGKINYNH